MSLRERTARELSGRLTPGDREWLAKEWDVYALLSSWYLCRDDVSHDMDRERAERTLNLNLRSAYRDPSYVGGMSYARSATANLRGDGMRPQVERCRAYCRERGYKVVSEASDVRSGPIPPALGWPPARRPRSGGRSSRQALPRPKILADVEQEARLRGLRVEYASEGARHDA